MRSVFRIFISRILQSAVIVLALLVSNHSFANTAGSSQASATKPTIVQRVLNFLKWPANILSATRSTLSHSATCSSAFTPSEQLPLFWANYAFEISKTLHGEKVFRGTMEAKIAKIYKITGNPDLKNFKIYSHVKDVEKLLSFRNSDYYHPDSSHMRILRSRGFDYELLGDPQTALPMLDQFFSSFNATNSKNENDQSQKAQVPNLPQPIFLIYPISSLSADYLPAQWSDDVSETLRLQHFPTDGSYTDLLKQGKVLIGDGDFTRNGVSVIEHDLRHLTGFLESPEYFSELKKALARKSVSRTDKKLKYYFIEGFEKPEIEKLEALIKSTGLNWQLVKQSSLSDLIGLIAKNKSLEDADRIINHLAIHYLNLFGPLGGAARDLRTGLMQGTAAHGPISYTLYRAIEHKIDAHEALGLILKLSLLFSSYSVADILQNRKSNFKLDFQSIVCEKEKTNQWTISSPMASTLDMNLAAISVTPLDVILSDIKAQLPYCL